jgi:hypothetical protein
MEHEVLPRRGRGTPLGRLGWTEWLGICAMYLLGWALSALGAFVVLLFVLRASDPGPGHLVLFFVFTAGPAAVIWVKTRDRYQRSLAAGLASSWLFTFWLIFLWHPWSTMSSEEVDRATAEIRDSGVPALYLGDQVGGVHWTDYFLGNDQVSFQYGECRGSDAEAGCLDWDIEVLNLRHSPLIGDFIAACERLDPILGAPAVTLGGRGRDRPGNIWIFTESTDVFLTFADDEMELEEKVALAETLRPIGTSRATTLPPPTKSLLPTSSACAVRRRDPKGSRC